MRSKLREAPPLRAEPTTPDMMDPERIRWARGLWHGQDDVLRPWHKSVEESLRMLAGQQNIQWNSFLGRWLDVESWMTDEERRWRQRPVVNRLLYWFTLTHSRLTENNPILTFQPATLDRLDALLAQVMDPVFKTIWSLTHMEDVIDQRAAWLIPCGEAYTISTLDMSLGDLRPRIGPAMLQGMDPYGRPMELYAEAVPYDENGNPLAQLQPDGSYVVTGEPYMEPEGQVVTQALCPLQVRGEWGQVPWHRKNWHMMYNFETIEAIHQRHGIEVQAESEPLIGNSTELARILHGSGYFGTMSARPGSEGIQTYFGEGFAGVWTMWQRPDRRNPQLAETEESPGGRLLIFTKDKVLYDGPREARFRYTSPIRKYEFIRVPGRPAGTSPQEPMNPLQRTYNKGWGQILEFRNLCTNPIGLLDQNAGVKAKHITNRPGLIMTVLKRAGVKAFEYEAPPRLGDEVWRTQQLILEEMRDFGSIEGAEGRVPTADASGELVKELRANSDRYLAATARRAVVEDARMVEDWMALIAVAWDVEKIITYAGEDQTAQTVVVYPEMFRQGRVNVIPDMESASTESKQQKRQELRQALAEGAFGPPGTPEYTRAYLEIFRFPHLGRMSQWGGTDGVTARQENGKMALGAPAMEIPLFPWYDDAVHLAIHEDYMKSPEFLDLDPMIQQEFMLHWQEHFLRVQEQLAAQAAAQAQQEDAGQGAAGAEPAAAPAA